MEEIGKLLRETRVSKNISLEEVCNELRIQEKYIVAIENGDRDAFVAEVYCRTFMRSYATFLGLNAEEILKKYTESVGGDTKKNRPRLIDIPDAYRDNRSFFVKERKFFRRIGNNSYRRTVLILMILILAIGVGAFWFIKSSIKKSRLLDEYYGNEGALIDGHVTVDMIRAEQAAANQPNQEVQPAQPVNQPQVQPAQPESQAQVQPNPPAPPASQAQVQPNPPAPPASQAQVQPVQPARPANPAPAVVLPNSPLLQGLQQAAQSDQSSTIGSGSQLLVITNTLLDAPLWVRVDVDGIMVFEGNLPKAAQLSFRANDRFRIRVGYAKALRLSFNGREIDSLSGAASDGTNTIVLRKE